MEWNGAEGLVLALVLVLGCGVVIPYWIEALRKLWATAGEP